MKRCVIVARGPRFVTTWEKRSREYASASRAFIEFESVCPHEGIAPPVDQCLGDRTRPIGIRFLGGKRHRERISLAVLQERARQLRVGIDDEGRILGTAALVGHEGTFEVNAGNLVCLRQLREGLRASAQHLRRGGHAGSNKGGRPVAAMLLDSHKRSFGTFSIGEGFPASTVAMHINEAGQEGRIGGFWRLNLII